MPALYETIAEKTAELVQKQIKITGRPKDFTVELREILEPTATAEAAAIEPLKLPVTLNSVRAPLAADCRAAGGDGDDHGGFERDRVLPGRRIVWGASGEGPGGGAGRAIAGRGTSRAIRCGGDLARQRDNLEGTKVVVWCFLEGSMVLHDQWKKVPVIRKN